MNGSAWTLALAAATVGALHTMAPDHWMPFVALARARGWTPARTARTTILCGFGHVTVTALLGIAALSIGLSVAELIGGKLANLAPALLMVFGTAYMIWGVRRSLRRDPLAPTHSHDHHHAHGHHDHDHGLTQWSLFVLFSSDPCVALIPMIIASAGFGWPTLLTVILTYELATIGTMVVMVSIAHVGARKLHAPWLDRYGDAIAGGVIVFVGAMVRVLGI